MPYQLGLFEDLLYRYILGTDAHTELTTRQVDIPRSIIANRIIPVLGDKKWYIKKKKKQGHHLNISRLQEKFFSKK